MLNGLRVTRVITEHPKIPYKAVVIVNYSTVLAEKYPAELERPAAQNHVPRSPTLLRYVCSLQPLHITFIRARIHTTIIISGYLKIIHIKH